MKISIWDILSILIVIIILILGILFIQIFSNPHSFLNPFPPGAGVSPIVLPSATPTLKQMPPTWTPNAETQAALAYLATRYPYNTGTPGPSPTGYVVPDTLTPTETATWTPTPTWTKTYAVSGPTSTKCVGCTATETELPPTSTPHPVGAKSATEKSGVKSNSWQKRINNPTFTWASDKDLTIYWWYWGPDPDGTDESDGHSKAVHHDSSLIDFTPPPVTGCGAYYLRVKNRYTIPNTKPLKYSDSEWTTIFIFKYDNDPPVPPAYANIGIKGAIRGIQNISGNPNFNWAGVNGFLDGVPMPLIPAGDYVWQDVNSDGDEEVMQCSGMKGYYVYWGPDPNGVSTSTWKTSPAYNPSSVKANSAYYLRVQSVDNMDNRSSWRTVALDEDYIPAIPPPTLDEAVFYYDTVRPNNITGITESYCGYFDGDPFTTCTDPHFTFAGGEDPVGYHTDSIWGYNIIWGTNPDAKPTFQKSNEFWPYINTSGAYYLRVRAVDWAGNTSIDWRQFRFLVDSVGPVGIKSVTVSPSAAKSNVYQHLYNDVSFTWSMSGVKDPGDYNTSSGLMPGVWAYWGTDPEGVPGDPVTTSYSPGAVTTGEYYFRLMVQDNAGNQTITTPFVLKFDDTPPEIPTITERGRAQDGVPQKNVKDPRFDWSGTSDVGSGLAGFYVYWGTNPGGTSTKLVKSATYNPSAVKPGTYYMRVMAIDNAGNQAADWSTFTFIYDPFAP
jgi:hypothetical protein